MILNYEDFIVSTEKHCTFLHRTFRQDSKSLDNILRQGLESGPNIQSTATWQPRELEPAKNMYGLGNAHGDTVVVIQIPRQLFEKVRADPEYRGEEVLHEDIGYLPDGRNFTVKPEFVTATIDKKTNEVKLNPYHKK